MLDPSRAIARWLRLAPASLHERLLVISINHLLRGQVLASRIGELRGKRFRLYAHDVPMALTFEIDERGIKRSALAPDVTFRGTVADFIALAMRREDPDTLFFQRRLSVEGETEVGLHLKNLLDGWEYEASAHVRAVFPTPIAHAVLRINTARHAVHELSRLRRPHSRRNNRRARNHRER